jgi:hypothetical protein
LAITKDAFLPIPNEFAEAEDQIINVQMAEFMESIKQLFIENYETDKSKDEGIEASQLFITCKTRSCRSIKSQQ